MARDAAAPAPGGAPRGVLGGRVRSGPGKHPRRRRMAGAPRRMAARSLAAAGGRARDFLGRKRPRRAGRELFSPASRMLAAFSSVCGFPRARLPAAWCWKRSALRRRASSAGWRVSRVLRLGCAPSRCMRMSFRSRCRGGPRQASRRRRSAARSPRRCCCRGSDRRRRPRSRSGFRPSSFAITATCG